MVYIILGNGFEPVEAITPCDILRRGGVDVKLAGIGGKTVEAAHGVTVAADCTVEEIDQNLSLIHIYRHDEADAARCVDAAAYADLRVERGRAARRGVV